MVRHRVCQKQVGGDAARGAATAFYRGNARLQQNPQSTSLVGLPQRQRQLWCRQSIPGVCDFNRPFPQ
jgi:hypothetical protein